ncbi:MAG: septum site-determining protein Ssd, partial [Pseudonocardiaceae bacterium]
MDQRPVVMVGPGELAEDLARLAAAAGCELDRAVDVGTVRRRWAEAPLVLLDTEAAAACAALRPPRRDRVVVLAATEQPQVWQHAVAVGAEHVALLPDAEAWLVEALADAVEAPAHPGR